MTVTNEQVFILRREKGRGASQGVAAARAGMSRQTAAKYLDSGKLPSELKKPRDWRTRINSFRDVWHEIEEMLRSQPGFHTKTVFEELCERHPGKFQPGQVRTLQRQVKQWRALHGDDSAYEVFFPQQHRAGEAAQTDFTHIGELEILVGGAEYKPLLCHVVLPYSGWQWATPCRSESLMALRRGIQDAFFRLGRVPIWHQTDNSTAATHGIHTKGRRFNQSYLDLMDHLGMKPRVIGVGKKEQNGSVEAYNGALKRLLDQQLMRRGSRAFETEGEFAVWLQTVLDYANAGRGKRFDAEVEAMRELKVTRVPEFNEMLLRVNSYATVSIRENVYSLPPRFMNHHVKARIYENHIDFYFAEKVVHSTPRLVGRANHAINYRHVIWSLVRKPGAFERYRYRDDMFPTTTFRRAYEALQQVESGTKADASYLRLLHLAASTMESDVDAALSLLLDKGETPEPDRVRELVSPAKPTVPTLAAPAVDLSTFDELLDEEAFG